MTLSCLLLLYLCSFHCGTEFQEFTYPGTWIICMNNFLHLKPCWLQPKSKTSKNGCSWACSMRYFMFVFNNFPLEENNKNLLAPKQTGQPSPASFQIPSPSFLPPYHKSQFWHVPSYLNPEWINWTTIHFALLLEKKKKSHDYMGVGVGARLK